MHISINRGASLIAIAMLLAAGRAHAQAASEAPPPAATETTSDDIIVTATKRVGGISVHNSALAVTAFDDAHLADTHVDQLADLTRSIPNVFLNASDTIQGVNNFSIRGMAVYDTIPSNTPTVGIFVDGVYIGASAASALNTFDNASIEVLRGPQGLLFGRNVTAGAILVNTGNPTPDLHVSAQAAIESGPSFTESLVVTGPLTKDHFLQGKLAIYRNDDEGYFRNAFDGRQFGKSHSTIARAALAINPAGRLHAVLRYEHGAQDGQGPASQNHGAFSYDSFDFSINEPGFSHNRWDQLIVDTRLATDFGHGEIVNVFGWRQVDESGLFDADSTPQTFFHFGTAIGQHQVSDELRYSGTFGAFAPTIGVFYYTDDLSYIETRQLAASNITGGGTQKSTTYAVFSNVDISLGSTLTLTLGARYSVEKKTARVQGLVATATSPCSFAAKACTAFNFSDDHDWSAFTPKIGLQWRPDAATNIYAYYTKGFRSGGYNLRQTNLLAPPGPYDQEVENSFEIGAKRNFFDNRLRLNIAVFDNEFSNLQRAILTSSPTLGIIQTTVNSADTRIRGIEGEVNVALGKSLRLGGHFGYLDNHWKVIRYHLLGAGPVTPADYALQLPFLSPWSYGGNISYAVPTALGRLSFDTSFDHRDSTPSNDANTGILKAVNRIDASLALRLNNGLTLSLYGKNLTDQTTTGLNNPLTFTPGETIAPLNKGRVLGAELRFRY